MPAGVAPVEHSLATADELLERVLAQLADVGVEGPQERLRDGHPVLGCNSVVL